MRSALLLAALAFCLSAGSAVAGAVDATAWNLEPPDLFEAQAPEDISKLINTLSKTRLAASIMEQHARASGANQLALIRLNYASREYIWLLYRVGEQTFVTQSVADDRRIEFGWVYETVPAEWDALFDKLRSNRQKPPTPVATGLRLQGGLRWPRGYLGVVNLDNNGDARTYLLATDDFHELDIQGPIDALLCSTVFSGMHCRMGDRVTDGWLLKAFNALNKNSKSTGQVFLPNRRG